MPEKQSKVFFPNLNGVRAIAALMVVIAHIELEKKNFGISTFELANLENLGRVGVSVFFALSGFLITYLLLAEKNNFGKVSFGDFYVRRLLRIWPLYFLVILFGFFIYPASGSTTALYLSIFFLPNLAFSMGLLPSLFDPIWSIGTEEQFYIFHPHFFRLKNTRNVFYALLLFLGLMLITVYIIHHFQDVSKAMGIISKLTYYARFDIMVVGALVSVLFYNTRHHEFKFSLQSLFNLFFHKYFQIFLVVAFLCATYAFIQSALPAGELILGTLSALLIVNLCNESSIYQLSNTKLAFIGKISYGIYMIHKFPVYFIVSYIKKAAPGMNGYVQNLIIYSGSILITIVMATVLYYGFEKYFLTFKNRFAKITQK